MKNVYIILFYQSDPLSAIEKEALIEGLKSKYDSSVKLLDNIKVNGQLPSSPDDYVIATCLLRLKSEGIELETPDVIQYKSGKGIGMATIIIKDSTDTRQINKTDEFDRENEFTDEIVEIPSDEVQDQSGTYEQEHREIISLVKSGDKKAIESLIKSLRTDLLKAEPHQHNEYILEELEVLLNVPDEKIFQELRYLFRSNVNSTFRSHLIAMAKYAKQIKTIIIAYKLPILESPDALAHRFYFTPNIPKDKLFNAAGSYASIVDKEEVLALIDVSAFGNAKVGLVLTEKRIYSSTPKKRSLDLNTLQSNIHIEKGKMLSILRINNSDFITFSSSANEAMENFAEMLIFIAYKLKANSFAFEDKQNVTDSGNAKQAATRQLIGREPNTGEVILCKAFAIRSFNLWAHMNCVAIITNNRVIFWDRNNDKYSFEIPIESLRTASISSEETFQKENIVINFPDGKKYEICLNDQDNMYPFVNTLKDFSSI